MSEQLIQIFADCTQAIEQGQLSVDECLDKYPQYRAELTDLLLVAMQARAVPPAYPAPDFRQQARARLLAQLPPRPIASNGVVSQQHRSGLIGAVQPVKRSLQNQWQILLQRWPLPAPTTGLVLLLLAIVLFGVWLRPDSRTNRYAGFNQPVPPGRLTEGVPVSTEIMAGEGSSVAEIVGANSADNADGSADNADNNPGETAVAAATALPETAYSAFLPLSATTLQLNAHTAAVERLQGLVEIQDAEGNWTAVERLAAVTAGQRIRTRPFTNAQITFYDGSQALIGPNSEISIDELDAQRPGDGFRTVVMTQWTGESEHHVDFRNDAASRYEVNSPNGSGRARGTVFQVLVTPDRPTYYIVTEGRVDVTNANVTVIVVAGQTSTINPQQPPSQPRFTVSGEGEVTAVGDAWVIGGQTFAVPDSTIIVGNPQIGDIASVFGYLLPDGTLVASHIILLHHASANRFMLSGEVESIAEEVWVVAGQPVAVDDATVIDPAISVGHTAWVRGVILADGTLLAERISGIDGGHPFEFVGIVDNISTGEWVIAGIDIAVDDETEIQGEIAVGDVVKVEGVILADGTWLAYEIKTAGDEAGFELIGAVDSIEPWLVAGVPFDTDAFTEIDSGIELGDLVYVEGQILSDGTWLAREIRLLTDEVVTLTIIGTVESIDPWIVSGLLLAVDENTLIDEAVEVGAIVRVRAVILPDGTVLATMIERLNDDDDPLGCFTVTTIVLSISGNQLIVEGLDPITLNEDIIVDGDIAPNTTITITICISQDGAVTIISIIVIIYIPPPPPPPAPGDDPQADKVTICHYPNNNASARHTIEVSRSAWETGHIGHGDTLGPCP